MKKILIVLLVLVAGLAAFIATRPAAYHLERTATIAAPADVIHARLNDFHAWTEWSPWEHRDPNMTRTFGGPEAGVGAVYGWAGNDDVGEGRMTIRESIPGEKVSIQLDFIKPFAATCTTAFTLAPSVDGTRVTWTMDGENDFLGKAFTLFMPMEKTVGPDFEQGLAKLQQVAEAAAVPADSSAAPGAAG